MALENSEKPEIFETEQPKGFSALSAISILIFAVVGVYLSSFNGVFLLDDISQIVDNEYIRSLAWPIPFLENTRRPLLYLTLSLNYSLGTVSPFGYHLVNLLIHLASTLLVFGCARRIVIWASRLESQRRDSVVVAFFIALLWAVHPIQTQSVTYIIQRAESLCGMFYLLTFYSSLRYFLKRKNVWLLLSILMCLAGGLVKEVIVTAPFLIWLFDRVFVSKSVGESLRRHGALYSGLLLPLVLMVYLLAIAHPESVPTAGFGMKDLSPATYLVNQGRSICRYLALMFWPSALVFDYGWKPLLWSQGLALPGAAVMALLVFVLALFRFFPPMAFLGTAFFILLLPSSSFIPLKDLIFEYRMYLPSIFVVAIFVLTIRRITRVLPWGSIVFRMILCMLALALSFLTVQRNLDYQSAQRSWQHTIKKAPQNARAITDMGLVRFQKGMFDEALSWYDQAIVVDPGYANAYLNRGVIMIRKDLPEKAETDFRRAIALDPNYSKAYANLGLVLLQQGRANEAVPPLMKALQLDLEKPEVYQALGQAWEAQGKKKEAEWFLRRARRMGLH